MLRRWTERGILFLSLALLAAACGTGQAGQGGHGDRGAIPDPGSLRFIKYDALPDVSNLLGKQAVIPAHGLRGLEDRIRYLRFVEGHKSAVPLRYCFDGALAVLLFARDRVRRHSLFFLLASP